VNSQIQKYDSEIISRRSMWDCVAIIMIVLVVLASLYLGWMKQERAFIHAFDTGIYLQILSNLSNGLGWSSSITGEDNFLAHHFQPVVALLVPFFHLSPRPFMLFCCSALAALVTIWIVCAGFWGRLPRRYLCSVSLLIVLHPSIFSRMMHSFVPEVLSLPAMTLLAIVLIKGRGIFRIGWPVYVILVLFAGASKETIWPCLAACCFLHGAKWVADRYVAWVLGAFCAAMFCFLFFYWMPQHTNMPSYYGLRYYLPSGVERPSSIIGWIEVLLGNLLSVRSLNTLVNSVAMPVAFLPLLGPWIFWVAALPGLVFILCSTHLAVHHPGNHYQIIILPFFFVGILSAIESRALFSQPSVKRWLPVLVLLPSLWLYDLPMSVADIQTMARNEHSKYVARDITKAKNDILKDRRAKLIVDANLQPYFYDYLNLRVLLPFVSNPTPMTDGDFRGADFIVTLVDVRGLDCRSLLAKPGSESLQYDYEAFYAYCDAVKGNQSLTSVTYSDSGLVVYAQPSPAI
jgi:uncharacterized membrane protein